MAVPKKKTSKSKRVVVVLPHGSFALPHVVLVHDAVRPSCHIGSAAIVAGMRVVKLSKLTSELAKSL